VTTDFPFSILPIDADHELDEFNCGSDELNAWLRLRARANETNNASRTFVAVSSSSDIAGYYSLSSGAVGRDEAQGFLRRNMPDPVPVLVLGRLAVDLRYQAHGLGRALVGDAIYRVLRISSETGVKGLIVHALTDEVISFYSRIGFKPYRSDPRDLVLLVSTIEQSLR
jgi:predicted N-acetyltransferase YhbS